MNTVVAFQAALLFQISHRFFSSVIPSKKVQCPAITEYNGPDVSMYVPPIGWAVDDRMPVTTTRAKRRYLDRILETDTRTIGSPRKIPKCAVGSRKAGSSGRADVQQERGIATASSSSLNVSSSTAALSTALPSAEYPSPDTSAHGGRRKPSNPVSQFDVNQFFAATLGCVDTSFPRPSIHRHFDFNDDRVDTYEKASALLALACFFDPRTERDQQLDDDCKEFLIFNVDKLQVDDEVAAAASTAHSRDSDFSEDSFELYSAAALDEYRASMWRSPSTSSVTLSRLISELSQYANAPVPKTSQEFEIVKYWRESRSAMPLLSNLALYVSSIPCSSAAIERVFSIARNHFVFNQYKQKPETLRDRLMMYYNGILQED